MSALNNPTEYFQTDMEQTNVILYYPNSFKDFKMIITKEVSGLQFFQEEFDFQIGLYTRDFLHVSTWFLLMVITFLTIASIIMMLLNTAEEELEEINKLPENQYPEHGKGSCVSITVSRVADVRLIQPETMKDEDEISVCMV
jgi:hypothetical protein